jgi:hypothetical protein
MKKYGIFTTLLVSTLVFAALSCSTEGALQQILGKSAEPPVFLDCRPVSSTEMVFKFSQAVNVKSLYFDPPLEIKTIDGGEEVTVVFAKQLEEGKKVTADIIVEDSGMNTLNVVVPFRARNDRMPDLVFNELRTENSKPKVEFVEFLSKEAGNLGAMRLFIAGHSVSTPAYEFPTTEVKAGEYIVLHLRTVEEGCLDETGTDLALSGGTDAQGSARDFWLPGNAKLLHKTDALWLVDQDDRIIDAVLLSENSDAKWKSEKIAEAASLFGKKKAWLPSQSAASGSLLPAEWEPGPSGAVITAGVTPTRTICRDQNLAQKPCAGNWYITDTSSATPGKANNPKRYTPKN